MTVFQVRIHDHLNSDSSDLRTLSVYAGADDETLAFAGHLTLHWQDADTLVDVLDSYAWRAV